MHFFGVDYLKAKARNFIAVHARPMHPKVIFISLMEKLFIFKIVKENYFICMFQLQFNILFAG